MKTLPQPRYLYRKLVARDPAFDGLFIVGVKTTGVFCRPVCPARKPRIENVEFFATADQAVRAGYRPCKRCRPAEAPGADEPWATNLMAECEGAVGGARISNRDLRAKGLSPDRVRRYFRSRYGVSFQAYQRSRRLGLALNSIRAGDDLLHVAYDAGFESDSGFRTAFQKLFNTSPGRARRQECIVASLLRTPIGGFFAAATSAGVCLFEFADRPALQTQANTLRRWFDAPVIPGMNEHLERLREEMREYFAGTRKDFDVPLAVAGTDFQQAVWRALRAIPFGQTRSYEQIAIAIGQRTATRAVAKANGDNRLAILIPCHRVIGKSGDLTGYGGGLWRKRFLLEHERAVAHGQAAGAVGD